MPPWKFEGVLFCIRFQRKLSLWCGANKNGRCIKLQIYFGTLYLVLEINCPRQIQALSKIVAYYTQKVDLNEIDGRHRTKSLEDFKIKSTN